MTLLDDPQLQAISVPTPVRVEYRGLSWKQYLAVTAAWERSGRRLRSSFDAGHLEIIVPSPLHEVIKAIISRLLELWAYEHRVKISPFGSVTCRLESQDVGLEPDECYFVGGRTAPITGHPLDVSREPAPNLAVEIDVTNSSVPRQPIYAAMGVREIWRWADGRLQPLGLESDRYVPLDRSALLPDVPLDLFVRWTSDAIEAGDTEVAVEAYRAWSESRKA